MKHTQVFQIGASCIKLEPWQVAWYDQKFDTLYFLSVQRNASQLLNKNKLTQSDIGDMCVPISICMLYAYKQNPHGFLSYAS